MRVIILGSEGFVGKNMSEYLSSKCDLLTCDIIENGVGKNYMKVDVRNFDEVKTALQGVDVVIDLVAHTLTSSFDQIVENARVNIIGLINVLEASRINGIKKVIFPSASSMIGIAYENPVTENHAAVPKTPYGVTKLASEHYLRIYNELYGINFVIFRFFNIYGPHQLNGLIPNMLTKIKKNESIQVFGKGDQVRDYVFIKDVPEFFEKAMNSNMANNKIINMGTGNGYTVMDVIHHISKSLHIKPNIEYKPERPGEISNFVADVSFLKKLFGSVPKTSLDDGIEETIKFHTSNKT